ncbi:hypothetical protein [Halalkalibacter oceani]|uniref:hypothetical protein n=1 Tax=Halalkalibacter oceani TaxID=1653776 RepID=UPI00339B99CF
MAKQRWLLLPAALLFVTIWTLVIVQFLQTGSTDDVSLEETAEAADPFNEQQRTDDGEEEGSAVADAGEGKGEDSSEADTINLTEFDFNDISTPAGVPIDGILSKLHLD